MLPHAGSLTTADPRAAAEQYRHPFAVIRGTGTGEDPAPVAGLSVEGDGVVLSSLRRREEHLELRIVNESAAATAATIRIPLAAAREADLFGRPGADLPLTADGLALTLGPWEIRTVQLLRR